MTAIDIDHLRTWVGREQRADEVLDPFPARALAGLLDREVAPRVGEALPLPWHWLYFLDTPRRSAIGDDGHPARGGFLPPVPLPRRMWAAGRVQSLRPLVLGESAVKTSTVQSVDLKEGRNGPLVFVNVEHHLHQSGALCLSEVQNIVYREAPAAPVPLPGGEAAPSAADWQRSLVPDAPLLFRFSALTYNGHRIHYDADYAKQVEFYPGLVVHGPLQAVLLLDLLHRERPGAVIENFSFRAQRPVFVDQPIQLAGRVQAGEVELWTSGPDGALAMRALVRLA